MVAAASVAVARLSVALSISARAASLASPTPSVVRSALSAARARLAAADRRLETGAGVADCSITRSAADASLADDFLLASATLLVFMLALCVARVNSAVACLSARVAATKLELIGCIYKSNNLLATTSE